MSAFDRVPDFTHQMTPFQRELDSQLLVMDLIFDACAVADELHEAFEGMTREQENAWIIAHPEMSLRMAEALCDLAEAVKAAGWHRFHRKEELELQKGAS